MDAEASSTLRNSFDASSLYLPVFAELAARGCRVMLVGGVPGVAPANVTVIGGGVSGTHAIRMAMGMEAQVTVIDRSLDRLRELDEIFGSKLNTSDGRRSRAASPSTRDTSPTFSWTVFSSSNCCRSWSK